MESKYSIKTWKEKAEEYFFESHLSIEEIAVLLDISRQSISFFLKELPNYQEEREYRKRVNQEKRKDYKKEKNREYRGESSVMKITGESLRREHDIAVLLLSREKYYN